MGKNREDKFSFKVDSFSPQAKDALLRFMGSGLRDNHQGNRGSNQKHLTGGVRPYKESLQCETINATTGIVASHFMATQDQMCFIG